MSTQHAGTGTASGTNAKTAAAQATIAAKAHLMATGDGRETDLALILATQEVCIATATRVVAELSAAKVAVGCNADGILTEQGLLEGAGVAVLMVNGTHTTLGSGRDMVTDPAGAARSVVRNLARHPDDETEPLSNESTLLTLVGSPGQPSPAHIERRQQFLDALRNELPPGLPIFGGGVTAERAAPWAAVTGPMVPDGDAFAGDAALGIGLHNTRASWGVSSDHQPLEDPLSVDRCHGRIIEMLSNRPAAEVLRDLCIRMNEPEDSDWGLVRTINGPGEHPFFERLEILAVNPDDGTILLSEPVPERSQVQFTLPDSDRASRDLNAMLSDLRRRGPDRPVFGVVHTQNPSGIAAVNRAFPNTPLIGWRTRGGIAPRQGIPTHHSAAAVVTMLG